MVGPTRPDGRIQLGVGVAGMRARLEQFGGELKIRTGRSGTGIVAMVPLPNSGFVLSRVNRVRMPGPSGRTNADGEALS
jgi:signal transduction histidine kinase